VFLSTTSPLLSPPWPNKKFASGAPPLLDCVKFQRVPLSSFVLVMAALVFCHRLYWLWQRLC
jgi:hypothetical protein